jgi:hypothetical protein
VASDRVLNRSDDSCAGEIDLLVAAGANRLRRVDDVGDRKRPAVGERAIVGCVDDAVEGVERGQRVEEVGGLGDGVARLPGGATTTARRVAGRR